MKSILYVTPTFPTLSFFIENEVYRLRERGFRVQVVTLRGVGKRYQPEHAALVAITRPIGSPFAPAAWAALLKWLVRRPHVLLPEVARILWASRGSGYALRGHLGYLPAAARVATLVEREHFDQVHGAWAHFPATVAYLAARLTGRTFSMSGHAGSDVRRTQAFLGQKVRAARFVTACVRDNAELLRRLGGPGSRVEWIYHGVDLRRFDGRGRARAAEPLLVAVGRLTGTKGYDVAIRALALLGDRRLRPRLVIAGEGELRRPLESLVHELGLDRQVELLGPVDHGVLLPLYRSSWALLMPSVELPNGLRDGIPNVVVEAMAMGLPCIGSRAAGLPEIVVDGENGLLVPPGDAAALAAAIESLLAHPERIEALGERARERVTAEFDAEHNIERLIGLFADAPALETAASRAGGER